MIYFTSDTHYSHKNMVLGTSSWNHKKDSCRNYQTIEEHDKFIIDSINNIVGVNDILYHDGDLSFGGINNIWNFRKEINCLDIRLLLGNHDEHIKKNKVLPNCVRYRGKIIDTDELPSGETGSPVKARELFTSVENYMEITIEKQSIILMHYPIKSWNYADSGSWMLFGHLHGGLNDDEFVKSHKTMDVGIDWTEFRPYSFEEIKEIMSKKLYLKRHI